MAIKKAGEFYSRLCIFADDCLKTPMLKATLSETTLLKATLSETTLLKTTF